MQDLNHTTPRHGVKNSISIQGEAPPPAQGSEPGFVFGRMFAASDARPMQILLRSCAAIGAQMTSVPEADRADSDMPAGYTYFGQFVDHDISMDTTAGDREQDDAATPTIEATALRDLTQERSPSLDLDSLYGTVAGIDAALVDGARFRIGRTSPTPGFGAGPVERALGYDLPRRADGTATIGDPRNDENLAVAQIHLLWLRFHNLIAAKIEAANPSASPTLVFEITRDLVTRHYQYIVMNDYLPRILNTEIFDDIVVDGNRKVLPHVAGESAFMPLEFSVAAYRMGHAQVREIYEWNVNFSTGGAFQPAANFRQLFEFSNVSGSLAGLPTLASNWIPDLRRLFDLSSTAFPHLAGSTTGPVNLAKALDPFIASALSDLPELKDSFDRGLVPFTNLAALNLRRGGMRGLPSGQDVSRALRCVTMLTKTQMRAVLNDAFDTQMELLGFYERTPLWLYILIEAAATGDGNRLGKLGSTLVADTFVTLALTSRTSILTKGSKWTPTMAQADLGSAKPLETMADIIVWMDEIEATVDPLQDARIA